jgi:dihydrofolate reductase
MRRFSYRVAMSVDGFIAGPEGEIDWITIDPAIDFAAIWAQYDTLIMGRKSYEIAKARRASLSGLGQRWFVASTTLKREDNPGVTILASNVAQTVAEMKQQGGKDMWLSGGGVLFRSMLDAGLVDSVDVTVIPVMLGSGVPLMPAGRRQVLHLESSKALASGILMQSYAIRC